MLRFALALALLSAPALAAPPAWSVKLPIYEINPEHFSAQGGFAGIQAELPRLKALGAGILWLTPIHPRGVEKAFKSPYCIRDYKAVHPGFGSLAEFKGLVKAAHAQGLYVILDFVGNHTSYDHPWVKQHPEWYQRDAQGRPMPVKGYIDIFQLDLGQPALRAALIDVLQYWVREADVDGYRVDMAWKMPTDFWAHARAELEKTKPVFLLAEGNDVNQAGPFDADYDWHLVPPVKDSEIIRLAKGKKGAETIDTALFREAEYPMPPRFFRLRMTSNHDQWNDVGTPGELYGPAAPALAVLMATLPGKPLVYNGQEVGWEARTPGPATAWNTPADPPIDFSPNTRAAWHTGFYTRLLQLYQASPALHAGSLVRLHSSDTCRSYAYLRQHGDDEALVLLNLSATPASYELEHPYLEGAWKELFSGRTLRLDGHWVGRAEPWSYEVWVKGPAAAALLPQFAQPLAPGWSASTAPVGGACPTPVAYSDPLKDPKPIAVGCLGRKAKPLLLDRLASGVNPEDVSARFQLAWTPDDLWLDVTVKDKRLHNSHSNPWENDAVELYLDLDNARKGDYQPDDRQFILVLGKDEAWEGQGRIQGSAMLTTRDEDGWKLTFAIPWATLGHKPKAGQVIAFDLGVNFNQDGDGRLGQLLFNGTSDNYRDTRNFARFKLEACK